MGKEQITAVVFRKYKDGDVIALFPYDIETLDGEVGCYMHVGQHGSADYHGVIAVTKPASEVEYADLKRELESNPYQYKFKVLRKASGRLYSKAVNEMWARRKKA